MEKSILEKASLRKSVLIRMDAGSLQVSKADAKKFIQRFEFPNPEPGQRNHRNSEKFHKQPEPGICVKGRINITHDDQAEDDVRPVQNGSDFFLS